MGSNFALVTGAAGFIGSKLTQTLLDKGRNVLAIDCFLPDLYGKEIKRIRWKGLNANVNNTLIKLEFDLRTDDFLQLADYNIDSIFNQAAMPGLQSDWGKFAPYYECNLFALNRFLEYAKTLSLSSFIQASTSSVYGRSAIGIENQNLKPNSPYGVSKLAAEKLLLAYREEFAVPTKILRYFSVYGPNQRPDMAYSRIISSILRDESFTLYGDGEQQRSNTYIDDIIDATILAESKAEVGDILNICGNETVTLNEAIRLIEVYCGKRLKVSREPSRKGDQRDTSGSNGLALRRLGWFPKVKFVDGIRHQISAQLDNS